MFRTLYRSLTFNPLDSILRRAKKKQLKHFLLCWNRGLGDIALGLYSIVYRIYQYVPDAKITFLVRKNLEEGFYFLKNVNVLAAPDWERKKEFNLTETLSLLNLNKKDFDVIIEKPDPTYWVRWQKGKIIPKLEWNNKFDDLFLKFNLEDQYKYIAVQPFGETDYNTWRNWPFERWEAFFDEIDKRKNMKVILFGFDPNPIFNNKCIVDLRGKTKLSDIFSIIKNKCSYAIFTDSGLLSFLYYLNVSFPIRVITLWSNPRHGILKQNVISPNNLLEHFPLISKKLNDLSYVEHTDVIKHIEE